MDPFGGAQKRPFSDAPANGNGGMKRSRPDTESFASGIGSKSKPCTKFFSTSGCPFGEGCHFLHFVPGGINVVSQMANVGNSALSSAPRNPLGPPLAADHMGAAVKTRMCNKFNTPEGCKFGDKCHFAHGERELRKPIAPLHLEERPMIPPAGGNRMPPGLGLGRMEPPPPGLVAAASFGVSASTKISIDASLSGAIIGKGGANSKQIQRVTGAKLTIRDHETDPNQKNIQFEGTFDQIKQATALVRDLIANVGPGVTPPGMPARNPALGGGKAASPNNFKTKLCENFAKGSCTFGDRCHFAHGAAELRKSGGI